MAAPKGRGYAMALSKTQELRKPGVAGLKMLSSNSSPTNETTSENSEVLDDKYKKLCHKICDMTLLYKDDTLGNLSADIKSLCNTTENFELFIDNIFKHALKNKWNAHAVAVFCEFYGDFMVDQVKLRRILLRKLQELYNERNRRYKDLDKFLLDATFTCEIFHHMLIEGHCIQVLAHPIIDYLVMLVDGASLKEIEVFLEQFPKCFTNLKENDCAGMDMLLSKIRKQIVSDTTAPTVRAMLLEMFEMILTDWKPLTASAEVLYEALSKPVVKVCY